MNYSHADIKKRLYRSARKSTKGCILWMGSTDSSGYGQFVFKSKYFRAHRISYEIDKGPIPVKMLVCHTCDVRRCFNPDHLFLGTHKDNARDAVMKGRISSLHQAKLNSRQVKKIREEYATGNFTHRELAALYGITKSTVWDIVRFNHWVPKSGVPKDLKSAYKGILNFEKAKEIRRKYTTGKYTHKTLAIEYGIHASSIGKIIRFESYACPHVALCSLEICARRSLSKF